MNAVEKIFMNPDDAPATETNDPLPLAGRIYAAKAIVRTGQNLAVDHTRVAGAWRTILATVVPTPELSCRRISSVLQIADTKKGCQTPVRAGSGASHIIEGA